jgi:tRNA nucleotidyltransferase (CCA-adding enzyme)
LKGKEQYSRAADIIRFLKHWVLEHKWEKSRSKPSSYLIELLVLAVLHKRSFAAHEAPAVLQEFWRLVSDPSKIDITWDQKPHETPQRNAPLILDPVNNTNNVAAYFLLDELRKAAEGYLRH